MTFEEKLADTWYNNSKSTAADLIQSAIDEGYTLDEAKEKIKGTKWEPDKRGNLAKAYKKYDELIESDKAKLEEKRRGRLYGHKPEDQPLLPGLEEGMEIERVESKKAPTAEQIKSAQEKAIESIAERHAAATPDKFKKIISDAKEGQKPKATDGRRMKIETAATGAEEPDTDYQNQLGWMLSDEGYNAKGSDGKDLITAVKLVAKAKEEGLSREELEESLKGTPWENSGNVMAEIEKAYPEETATPTAAQENVEQAQEEAEEESPAQKEIRGTFAGVDLSDGLSMSEADSIAKAYAGTSGNVKADMFLSYMRNNLKLSDEQIKKIVDATKTDSALRREFYEGKSTIENVGGVTGSEMRRAKEATDAMKKEFSNAYEEYKKDAEKAGKDVAKSNTYETERNPKSILVALINGEFGDISKDADPKERNKAISTALYLGGDVVATALRNVGASFKGGEGNQSMWQQRQKEKFEAATANANKALDAGTDTEIKGKQQAFDFKQAIEKSIDDGRIQKMFDSLGEDIKANDIMRDIAKYESVANTFQNKTLDQKARIILGMEMDGKQLSTQALVAMLATLTSDEYQQLGGRIAELAKGVGSGISEAVKGLFGNFFREPAPEGSVERTEQNVEDIARTSPEYRNKINEKLSQIGATFGNPNSVNLKSRVAKQIWERNASMWGPYNPNDESMKEAVYQTYLNALANPNTPDGRFILLVTDPDIYGPGTHGTNPDGSRSSGITF